MAEVKALRSASEADALEIIRRAGSVASVTALVAMLGWERTKTQRWLARRQRYGDIVLKPSGPGGKTMIEAARTPAQPPTGSDAQQRDHAGGGCMGRPRRGRAMGFAVQRRPLRVLAPRVRDPGVCEMGPGMKMFRCGNALPLPSPRNDHARF